MTVVTTPPCLNATSEPASVFTTVISQVLALTRLQSISPKQVAWRCKSTRRVGPTQVERLIAFGPNTCDRGIFIEVWLQNEYRLPPRFEPDDVIVDIGGHIGAFAHACLVRGAGKVITCEPEPGNLELLRQNLARWGDRIEIIPAAVWPADKSAPCLAPPANPYDTCQFSMAFRDGGVHVATVTLDEVMARVGTSVRLLKLDCEGAEYAILQHANLSKVQQVCGEAHVVAWGGRVWCVEDLEELLSMGYQFHSVKNGPTTSLFFAA